MYSREHIEALSPEERRRVLAALMGGSEPDVSRRRNGLAEVTRVARNAPVPLSCSQQRIWFLEQLRPNTATFNNFMAAKLSGQLNFAALLAAMNEIVRRHECLRTRFEEHEGEPRQLVLPELRVEIPITDISSTEPGEQDENLARVMKDEAEQPFDLGAGPLFRLRLVKLSDAEHVLLFNIHHIVYDAWSKAIIVRELAALYKAFHLGKPSPLPKLPLQYADYAAWQRKWLSSEECRTQLDYWTKRLADAPPDLALPIEGPRNVLSSAGARYWCSLGSASTKQIEEFCRRTGTTPFMVLLGAFKVLLARYSGQSDIVVGTPIANRSSEDLEALIGCFVNMLALRTDLSGDPSFATVVKRIQETALEAYAHQDLPFEELVKQLKAERGWGRPPLFQVLFTLQNVPAEPLALPGLSVSDVELSEQTAKYELGLLIRKKLDVFEAIWEYSTDLFEEETIRRLATHYTRLLEAALESPDRPVSELELMSEQEREAVLAWGQGPAREPERREARDGAAEGPAGLVHELFEAQAVRTPQAIALQHEGRTWTYAELNGMADRLARSLRRRGIGPEQVVGLCVERGVEMVVGLLGILKAGGAYLPLDPSYPPDRLAYMVRDAGPRLLLTQEGLRARLPSDAAEVVELDGDAWAPEPQAEEHEGEAGAPSPRNLACVIYTSGSAGSPKGVLLEHVDVLNALDRQREATALSGADVVCQTLAPGSVEALFETLGPLTTGCKLILADHSAAGFERLGTLLEERAVNHLLTTPSTARALLDASGSSLTRIEKWTLSGESLPVELVRALREAAPNCRVLGAYGTAETAGTAACAPARTTSDSLRIGRLLPNVRGYVLDDHLQPVPAGVIGELYLSGTALTRGYRGRPGLTAERFIACPFEGPGTRMYRTGDLVRYGADGELEFVGRRERQVIVRGSRVDTTAIEHLLAEHDAVAQAVVLLKNERCVAYVRLREGRAVQPGELRGYLKELVPEHMVPESYVTVDAFPLLPSGKLDLGALPAPQDGSNVVQAYQAPSSDVEVTIAGVWMKLLELERVGTYDNFFELGGHSLLAVQLSSDIGAAFGIQLPVAAIFQFPTVRQLAQFVVKTSPSVGTSAASHDDEQVEFEEGVLDDLPVVTQRGDQGARGDASEPRALGRVHRAFTALFGQRGSHTRAARRGAGPKVGDTLVALQPNGSKRPVFLVHPTDLSGHGYDELAARMEPDQPLFCLSAAVASDGTLPFASVEELAAHYLTVVRSVQPRGPYRLVGSSAGGLVAYEMAQQLLAANDTAEVLVLIDTFLPDGQGEAARHRLDKSETLRRFMAEVANGASGDVVEQAAGQGIDARLEGAWRALRDRDALPASVTVEEFRQRWNVFSACHRLVSRYSVRPYAGALTLLTSWTEGRPACSAAALKWSASILGGVRIEPVPAADHGIFRGASAQRTAQLLTRVLSERGIGWASPAHP